MGFVIDLEISKSSSLRKCICLVLNDMLRSRSLGDDGGFSPSYFTVDCRASQIGVRCSKTMFGPEKSHLIFNNWTVHCNPYATS